MAPLQRWGAWGPGADAAVRHLCYAASVGKASTHETTPCPAMVGIDFKELMQETSLGARAV